MILVKEKIEKFPSKAVLIIDSKEDLNNAGDAGKMGPLSYVFIKKELKDLFLQSVIYIAINPLLHVGSKVYYFE